VNIKVAKLGGEVFDVEVEESSNVSAVLTAASQEVHNEDLVMVNGSRATLETEVNEGDVVTLVPRVRGG